MITISFILIKKVYQLYFHSLENRKKKSVKKIDTNMSLQRGNRAKEWGRN